MDNKRCARCECYKPLNEFNCKSYCRKCNTARVSEWKKNNSDRVNTDKKRETDRRYRQTPQRKAYRRKYRKLHQVDRKIARHNHYSRKRGLPGTLTVIEWENALRYFKQSCAVCRMPFHEKTPVCIDHMIPLSDPETLGTVATNILPLCKYCNDLKHRMPLQLFIQWKYPSEVDNILSRINAYFNILRTR